jgi:hypothetical protein
MLQVVTTGLGSAMLWTPATKQFKALGGAFSKGEVGGRQAGRQAGRRASVFSQRLTCLLNPMQASRISTAFNPTTGRPWVAFLVSCLLACLLASFAVRVSAQILAPQTKELPPIPASLLGEAEAPSKPATHATHCRLLATG